MGCTKLASVTIPDSVTRIGNYTFYNCTSLASVTIPDSVANIGLGAFEGCTRLASVTFQGTIASSEFDTTAFYALGDLRAKFYARNAINGTAGTYTTTAPVNNNSVWTKQP